VTNSFIAIRRLRVMRNGKPVYDEAFHRGLNIIRGENGSGKSTISDFIFYVLGGEFDRWKPMARLCSEVQAEVETAGGVVTIKRPIGDKLTKPEVLFAPFDKAMLQGVDGWQRYPLHRQEAQDSFSQIMFRSAGIPEAISQGTSNITMHQLLRLMYSDQRTAPGFLFRYEDWDKRELREAVGDLLCGLSVYDRYDIELTLRDLKKEFETKDSELSSLLLAFEGEPVAATTFHIDDALAAIATSKAALERQVESVDEMGVASQDAKFMESRGLALKEISKANSSAKVLLAALETAELEISELEAFISYLTEVSKKLPRAERTAEIVGSMDFTHCPACLKPLKSPPDEAHCIVCGSEIDPEQEQSKYLQLRMDVELQLRESHQLLEDKSERRQKLMALKRVANDTVRKLLSDFSSAYEMASSPREVYLASRHQSLGQLTSQEAHLRRLRERAIRIELLSAEKGTLQSEINQLTDRLRALTTSGKSRRAQAMTRISEVASTILKRDWSALKRQAEFKDPKSVTLKFADNAITVDDEMNFAESSNVIVKNAAILALFISAASDPGFNHPRFALFDNIEDKGMEPERSHNFQKVIRDLSAGAPLAHQIIVTTSMMNPELETDGVTVGPYYTHDRKTLLMS
jgi:hypothetical protein